MEHMMVAESVRELSKAMPQSARYIQIAGHTVPGDGGDGLFHWRPDSTEKPNQGTVIKGDSPKGRWHRIFNGPVNIRWFGAKTDGSDATQAIQSALNSVQKGGTVQVPSGTFTVRKPLKLYQGTALIGDGLLSILNYYGPAKTGCIQSHDPSKSWTFHLARLNVEVQQKGAYGVDLRGMSYSRFDDLHIHLRKTQTSAFYGPGNGQSPYYNLFTACHVGGTGDVQSNGCIGFDFSFDNVEKKQSANAVTVIGGRINTCQAAVRCYGTGNLFYGQVLESNKDGYIFDLPPGRLRDKQLGTSNDIIGCYTEYVERVIVQKHGSCYVNALLSFVTGYKKVFDAVSTDNCIVITSHDGKLPVSRSFIDRVIDFKKLQLPKPK